MRSALPLFVVLSACGNGPGLTGSVTCGTGTEEVDGVCVASASCGPGTHAANGVCLGDRTCGMGTTLIGTECVGIGSVQCGVGTMRLGDSCISTSVTCGAGTMQMGTTCVATGQTVTCGTGTVLQGNQCVPAAAVITCGAGTTLQGNTCIANGATVTCGSGTTLQGNVCVGTLNVTCGAGTQLMNNQCIALGGTTGYEVRVPVRTVPADGYSKIPVLAIGHLMSGAPSMDAVVLTVNPSYAGSLSPSSFALGVLGTTTYFTPCASSSPACSGAFSIDMALASNPSVIVATTGTLQLQIPNGVGSPAPCLGTANTVFFNGDPGDYIHTGMETITQGTWRNTSSAMSVSVNVDPTQGGWWYLDFATTKLMQPMAVNVYTQAERAPFASPGHPGLNISGSGRGCNTLTGAFQVHELVWTGSTLTSFTATFEQHCEGGTPALRGCVHYQQ